MTPATLLAGLDERSVVVHGARLRYRVGGDGPPALLVHGLGGAATNWSCLARLLARRFRLIVPDLPGHGSSEPLRGTHGLSSFADAVAACLDREEAPEATLVGHSLGGSVAIRLALAEPERVSSLVLAAGAGISSTATRAKAGLRILGVLRPSRLAARHRTRVAASNRLKQACFGLLAGDPCCLSDEAVHGFLEGSASVTDTAVAGAALVADDPRAELHRLRCPVLVLWGARDWFLPLSDGHEFARRLGARLRVLPDTGHLLIAERPEECAGLIEAFCEDTGVLRPGTADLDADLHRVR